MDESVDLLEWRIEISVDDVLAIIRSEVWNRIRTGEAFAEDWERLFLDRSRQDTPASSEDLQAIVSFPIPPHHLRCAGNAPLMNSKEARERKRRTRHD
jgi:hypothetical protein